MSETEGSRGARVRGIGRVRALGFVLSLAACTLVPSIAHAALTSSEKAQVRDFYRSAALNQAPRIRALIARPDLSTAESADALKDATEPVPFNDARGALLKEVAFGAASDASRTVLAPALVTALLARADAVLVTLATREDARATAELNAIYTYLTHEIAEKTDATLPRTTRDDCAKAIAAHIDRNARPLRPDGGATAQLVPRALAEHLFFLAMSEGPTRRLDTADKLGLRGARRQMLIEWGILVVDGTNVDDTRIAALRGILERLPAARADLSLLVLGDKNGAFAGRPHTLGLSSDLATPPPPFWGEEVEPGDNSALAGAVGELARGATQRVLANRGELRTRAERDAAGADSAHPLGKPLDPSVEGTVAAVVQLLLLDGARTFDWALARFLSAKPDAAAILSDAVGVLAALVPPRAGQELTLPFGKRGTGGAIDVVPVTGVRLAPTGAAMSCTFGGHTWTFERDDTSGVVKAVKRDGQPVNLGMLPSARMPMSGTSSWSYDGLAFARLLGTPRAGMGPGPKVRLDAQTQEDVIATPAPGNDFVIEGELEVIGGEAGIGFRARTMRDTRGKVPHDYFIGGIVSVSPNATPPRIALITREERTFEPYMAAPVEGAFSIPMHVKIEVKGTKVDARVGNANFHGTLPRTMAEGGSIVLYAKSGAKVQIQALSIKKL